MKRIVSGLILLFVGFAAFCQSDKFSYRGRRRGTFGKKRGNELPERKL